MRGMMKVSIEPRRGAHLIVRVLLQHRVAIPQALVELPPVQGLHGEPQLANLVPPRGDLIAVEVLGHRDRPLAPLDSDLAAWKNRNY